MKIIGLAGESGTGKSTIAAYLTTRGGAHVDADIAGHDILNLDAEVRDKIREFISADVFDPDGRLDRRRLGALVFNDTAMLQALNDILHPAIRKECHRRVKELEASGCPFVVIDAALLLTSRMPFELRKNLFLRVKISRIFPRLIKPKLWRLLSVLFVKKRTKLEQMLGKET